MNYGDWKYSIGKVLRLFPGKTAGAIAKELGCSRTYAYKIQKELSTSGQLPGVEKRRGADGKERSVKRNVKQPLIPAVKDFGSDPASVQQTPAIRETTLKQHLPATHDTPKIEPFDFDTPSPVAARKNIEPSSSDLEREMNKMIYSLKKQISHYGQADRPYVLHRLKECLEIIEEEWEEAEQREPQNRQGVNCSKRDF
jgi:hypothetical protein